MCSTTVMAETETKCLGLKADGILCYYYFLKSRRVDPCCMEQSGCKVWRRCLGKESHEKLMGRKLWQDWRLRKARETCGWRDWLLFTTALCHRHVKIEWSMKGWWGDVDVLQPSPTLSQHASALLLPSLPPSSVTFPKSCHHICWDAEGSFSAFPQATSFWSHTAHPWAILLLNSHFCLGFPERYGVSLSSLCQLGKCGWSHQVSIVSFWKDLPIMFSALRV